MIGTSPNIFYERKEKVNSFFSREKLGKVTKLDKCQVFQ